MTTYTFRTEAECDIPKARDMLKALNAKHIREASVSDPNLSSWEMGIFTFDSGRSLKSLQGLMYKLMRINPRYVDLHRCAQTLNPGTEPNNEWFMQ